MQEALTNQPITKEPTTKQPQSGWDDTLSGPSLAPKERRALAKEAEQKGVSVSPVKTEREAHQLVKQAIEDLNEALSQGNAETLNELLKYVAKFNSKSISNIILIAGQAPAATCVEDYKKWQALDRQVVNAKNKGIRIWEPILKKETIQITNSDGDKGPKQIDRRTGVRLKSVFDISFTRGKGVHPSESSYQLGEPKDALSKLEGLIAYNEIDLVYHRPPNDQLSLSQGGRIIVSPDLSPPQMFAQACRELACELLDKTGRRQYGFDETIRQAEADATTFAVLSAFGLESLQPNSDLKGLYHGDPDVLKESLTHIQRASKKIIYGLNRASDAVNQGEQQGTGEEESPF